MFRPFAVYVGCRYARSKRSNHFISFMSMTSMLGVALGVMVLITVLSVMNGFSVEIRHKMLSYSPHVVVRGIGGAIRDWQAVMPVIMEQKGVLAAAPYILAHGMLVNNGVTQPAIVRGINSEAIDTIYPLSKNIVAGDLSKLATTKFGVVLGHRLAANMNVSVGEQITLLIPEATVSIGGVEPKFKRFTVVALFNTGSYYDDKSVFISLGDADRIFKMRGGVSGIQVKVGDELDAPRIGLKLGLALGGAYSVYDWTTDFASFFDALQMEKTVMWCILLLIIAVAAFNLVSSLVMMVADKRSDIAIMRTMGASARQVMGIFMTQGVLVGVIGTGFGLVGGLLLARNITGLADYIQGVFGIQFVSEDVYLIGHVPSLVNVTDVVLVCSFSLLMCLLATLYPAWRAARVAPAEALRYE